MVNEPSNNIQTINHVAIAVPNIHESVKVYKNTLGAQVSEPEDLLEHGVTVVFICLPNTKIELITPLQKQNITKIDPITIMIWSMGKIKFSIIFKIYKN